MHSFVTALLPSIGSPPEADMYHLYRVFRHLASRSADIARVGCHVTYRMGCAPLVLIGRAIFIIGGAIPIIAINYGILVACWILHILEVVQGALICRAMIVQSFWRGSLPFLDAIGALVANLYKSTAIHSPSYGGQFDGGLNSAKTQAKSIIVEDNDIRDWQFFTSDLLDSNHVDVDLVLQCVCGSAPSLEAHAKESSRRKQPIRHSRDGLFWRIVATNEQYLTYAMVVATLQLFLHLTGANVTTLFLPMLSQTIGFRSKAAQIGNAVLVLVNTGGILGSALATRQYGREVMCMISGVLIIFCQVAIPAIMEAHAGLGGGARMTTGYAAGMFALACAVSGGFSWSWGALFWAVPGERIRSVGQVVGMALGFGLGFAQMQCFLLMLRQLKHAVFAYYAAWIWS